VKTQISTTTCQVFSAFVLALVVAATPHSLAKAAQPIIISGSENPDVIVNLKAPVQGMEYSSPQRIIDGSDIIILVPPSLQTKKPAPKIVTPRVKPDIALPKIVKSEPVAETAEIVPIPVPPINPSKLPPATTEEIETAIEQPEKFETLPEKASLATAQPLPTPVEDEIVKAEIAATAAEKITPVEQTTKQEEPVSLPVAVEVQDPPVAEKEIVVASLPPEKKPDPLPVKKQTGELTRILFPEGDASLPKTAEADILAIADQLQKEGQNVQLIAYATGDSSSAARRMSLGRALSVRSKLMELGVKNNKIEVRALGQSNGDGPMDRVDLVMIVR
jgi:outer membrane protein OmpA-like peptidoglycan-associated protein